MLIEQVSSRPTCDINGIIGGYTGEGSKTVISAEASAKISFRLVEGQQPDKICKAFRDYVTARLPGDCKAEFTDHSSAPAIALDWNMKPLAAAKRALTDEWGKEALLVGSGASIPIVADFKRTLGLDTVLVGFGLDDDNIHSPNEKYDLKSFHKGIRCGREFSPHWRTRRKDRTSWPAGCDLLSQMNSGADIAGPQDCTTTTDDVVAFGGQPGDGDRTGRTCRRRN